MSRVPELAEQLVDALVRTVRVLRGLELRKAPSVAETIDWGDTARTRARHARRRRRARHAGRRPQAPVGRVSERAAAELRLN